MSSPTNPNMPLRLRAADDEDLAILSAALQDAIVPIGDVAYLPAERMFALVANRFKWEVGPLEADPHLGSDDDDEAADGLAGPAETYLRTNCGVRVLSVSAVHTRNLDLADRRQILELLHLGMDDGSILLTFAGEAQIRLDISAIDVRIEDVGQAWPTQRRPDHEANAAAIAPQARGKAAG